MTLLLEYSCNPQQIVSKNLIFTDLQEHLTVLRTMVVTFPDRFPELAALADVEEEIDFFNNIAHIQMHRRSRALARLSRVRNSDGIIEMMIGVTLIIVLCLQAWCHGLGRVGSRL